MRFREATAIIGCAFLVWSGLGSDSASAHSYRGLGYHAALAAKRASAIRANRLREARESEARHARSWVRRWAQAYGPGVGRWADDALAVGWPESQMWTLGRIIDAESNGNERARNTRSDCRGLLQLAPCHWRGRFDPYIPKLNLAYGLRLWRGSGWSPWVTY